jgi:peptidoglycan/xylan/chitin deacetylase (PgdA/CDA1 family)
MCSNHSQEHPISNVTDVSRRSFLKHAAFTVAAFAIGSPAWPSVAEAAKTPAPQPGPTRDALIARFQGRTPKQWGLEVTGVVTAFASKLPAICFTFDGCGGPKGSVPDKDLISLLRREKIATTLFLSGPFIKANGAYVADLAQDPLFLLGNHGTTHRPLSVNGRKAYGLAGTASLDEVIDEIAINKQTLEAITGKPSTLFRSGTAHYDEIGVAVAAALGVSVIGFNVNADAGASLKATSVSRALLGGPERMLSIGHFNHPEGQTYEGLVKALPGLRAKSARFVHLDDPAVSFIRAP